MRASRGQLGLRRSERKARAYRGRETGVNEAFRFEEREEASPKAAADAVGAGSASRARFLAPGLASGEGPACRQMSTWGTEVEVVVASTRRWRKARSGELLWSIREGQDRSEIKNGRTNLGRACSTRGGPSLSSSSDSDVREGSGEESSIRLEGST